MISIYRRGPHKKRGWNAVQQQEESKHLDLLLAERRIGFSGMLAGATDARATGIVHVSQILT
jgi:hypothetical protein